ncbi:hypothetical protein LJC22_06435, partial [Desulfosarcina sp. OttesenSCG-928-G10]|nr:hypothetical protein [Desulfosarcina sp. OttesenSCG-928-G10]
KRPMMDKKPHPHLACPQPFQNKNAAKSGSRRCMSILRVIQIRSGTPRAVEGVNVAIIAIKQ